MTRLAAALLVLALAACDATGTLGFALVFPQGQTRLPATAATVQLTVDDHVTTAPVAADGAFELHLDLPASGTTTQVTLAALDAQGATVAIGRAPPLTLTGGDDSFALFMSAPNSFALSPRTLSPARTGVAAVALPYGVLLAGGADPAPLATLTIFNAYDHAFQPGLDMPVARAGQTAVLAADGVTVDLFGGLAADGQPRADFFAFDTTVSPTGAYRTLTADPAFARAFAQAAPLGDGRYVVTGDPLLVLDTNAQTIADLPAAPLSARSATMACRLAPGLVALAGPDGVVLVDASLGFTDTASSAQPTAALAVPGGGCLLFDGTTIISLDAAGAATQHTAALAQARPGAALALTGSTLVVAGPSADAELLTLPELASSTTIPLASSRAGAQAVTLPNGAVLLVGGADPTATPVGFLELYQP